MITEEKKLEQVEFIGLLKSIFEFLLDSGSNLRTVRAIVDRAFSEAVERNRQSHQRGESGLATAGRVLDAWHRNRRYIDENAEPRAIRLLGRAPSVEALIKLENSDCDAAEFARNLNSLGLLSRSGRNLFKPVTRVAVIARLNPFIQQYVARSSVTLLRTIRHNVSTPTRSRRLIERFAEVPDLPATCAAEFRRFSHEQGWAMLKTLNDWLESRRLRRTANSDRRTVRAGVHLYAYLDPVGRENPS